MKVPAFATTWTLLWPEHFNLYGTSMSAELFVGRLLSRSETYEARGTVRDCRRQPG